MFCNNCGNEMKGDGGFCTSCGTQQSAANTQQAPTQTMNPAPQMPVDQYSAPPKQFLTKKLLLSLIAGVLAITLVVTGFATSGFGLINRRAQNPVALAYDGINGLLSLNSYSFSFNGSAYGDNARCEGYIKYAKAVDDIVFYAKASADGDSATVAMYQGSVYFGEDRDIYTINIAELLDKAREQLDDQISWINSSNYYSADEKRKMKDMYQKFQEMMSIDYINQYLKSGSIDREKLLDTMFSEDLTSNYFDMMGEDSPQKYFTPKAMQQAFELVEAFIHQGLEDEDALENALSSIDQKKRNGYKSYTCTIDFYNTVKELFNYISDNYNKYADLKSAAEGIVSDKNFSDDIADGLNLPAVTVPAVITAVRDLALGEVSYANPKDAAFTVTVNNKGVLQELNVRYDRLDITLKIFDQNSVKPDESTLQSLSKNAQKFDF